MNILTLTYKDKKVTTIVTEDRLKVFETITEAFKYQGEKELCITIQSSSEYNEETVEKLKEKIGERFIALTPATKTRETLKFTIASNEVIVSLEDLSCVKELFLALDMDDISISELSVEEFEELLAE